MVKERFLRIAGWSATIALILALTGCGTQFEQQANHDLDAESMKLARGRADTLAASAAQPPELQEGAGLNDYLVYAALNNPQLRSSFNHWKAALEMVAPARTLPDPRFSYSYFIRSVETRVGPQKYSASISQTFPWFGKLNLQGEAALAGARVAQTQYEAVKLELFDEVKQAYYELYYLGRAVSITNENVELLKGLERIAQSKYQTGAASNGDVIKAQVELDRTRDRLRSFENMKKPMVARLNAALNRPAEAPLPFPTDTGRVAPSGETMQIIEQLTAANSGLYTNDSSSINGLIARLQTDNPHLKGLDFQAEREQKKIALAKKRFFPNVTLGLNYVETGPALMPGTPESGKDPLVASISLNLPLWWGKYRAEEHASVSKYQATREARQDKANTLAMNLELAASKFQDAQRKIILYRDGLIPKANENLSIIQRSYQAGKSDFLSLIDANRELLEFQLTYERAVADREENLSTVQKLIGVPSVTLPERKR